MVVVRQEWSRHNGVRVPWVYVCREYGSADSMRRRDDVAVRTTPALCNFDWAHLAEAGEVGRRGPEAGGVEAVVTAGFATERASAQGPLHVHGLSRPGRAFCVSMTRERSVATPSRQLTRPEGTSCQVQPQSGKCLHIMALSTAQATYAWLPGIAERIHRPIHQQQRANGQLGAPGCPVLGSRSSG